MKDIIIIVLFLPTCFSTAFEACSYCPNKERATKYVSCDADMYSYSTCGRVICCLVENVDCFEGHKAVHKIDGKCESDRIATRMRLMKFLSQEVCCPPTGAKCLGRSKDATVPPCNSHQYLSEFKIENRYLSDKLSLCCSLDDIQKCPDGSVPHDSPCKESDYEHNVDGHKFCCELSAFKCPLNDIPTNAPCSAEQFLFKFEQGPKLCCDDAKCLNEQHPTDLPCNANQYEKEFGAFRKVCCELEELKCVDGEKPDKQPCASERYLTNLGVAENEQVCCNDVKCLNKQHPTHLPCDAYQYEREFGASRKACCELEELKCVDEEKPDKQPCVPEAYLTHLGVPENELVCCSKLSLENLKLSSNSKKCERNIDCGTGEEAEVCIFDGKIGEGKCYLNPMTYKSPSVGFPIMVVIVPIIIIIIILFLIGGGYLYYKKKINKEDKNTEKSNENEKKSQKKSISTPSSVNTPV
ncbi:unnamed protein product [Caenorhabditis angaria]|uniref:Domain of unknown function DX domain-containing protein n=1 Tax=Caenorhabditis angaria TaxID=860376 RepID=A0A9P1IFJ2_9PELO|nr:unnamed protein product [Caenorhabditis angaria]